MDRAMEIGLLEELVGLRMAKSLFLDDSVTTSPVQRYTCPDRFTKERTVLFRGLPVIAAHRSELAAPNDFLTREIAGLPVLMTRDAVGDVRAFLNVCRHRGTRLVNDETGCLKRFTCPYHAWTWNNRGDLQGIPHGTQGFPNLEKETLGLKRLGCTEAYGWIWVQADTDQAPDIDVYLGELAADMAWLNAADLKIAHCSEWVRTVNWKILIEGGIEAYHFRIAHRDTIGRFFQDNLSSYQVFGCHLRSILPRMSLDAMMQRPRESWRLRRDANLVYSIFPTSQLLVQEDHIVWVHETPRAADQTRIRLLTLVPVSNRKTADHWSKNHDITVRTLSEDFDIAESIQSGLPSGANDVLRFGRFEGALHQFNGIVERHLDQAQT